MSAEAAAAYFRQRPLERILALLRDRLQQLGRTGGTVRLPDPTAAEVRALQAFLAPRRLKLQPDGSLVLSLRHFEEALQASRFPCPLREALAAYFGAPLTTRAEAQAEEEAAWCRFCREAALAAPPGLADFAGLLRGDWRQDPAAVAGALHLVFAAIRQLPAGAPTHPGAPERLPIFANRVAGDPHAFDPDRLAGRLFQRALAALFPAAAAGLDSPALQRALLLDAAGLARDDLSSIVLAAGLTGPAPVLAAARHDGCALAYPLRTVRAWPEVVAATGRVFAVENPAVFGALLDGLLASGRPPVAWPTLVCTSGHLSAAAVTLLDRLTQQGACVWYSGDFDPSGLRIARGILRRYGARSRLWRMDPESYRRALQMGSHPGGPGSAAPASPRPWAPQEAEALAGLAPDFPELTAAMMEGRAAFQEALVPVLLGDLLGA